MEKIMSLAILYPYDFDSGDLRDLSHELGLYITETRKHDPYPMVYRLLKLVLMLPVAAATVERCFSAMKIVKTRLRNRIGDKYMSNSLICYVEKEEMLKVTNEAVVHRFVKNARS
jgi:hypothetical protein